MIRELLDQFAGDLQLQNEIQLMKQTEEPIILFGAGCTSQFIVEQMHLMGIYPKYFCDNDRFKEGKVIAGLEVLLPESLKNIQNGYYYITTQLYYGEIKKQLLDLGISEDKVLRCDIIYQFPWEREIVPYLESHIESLERFYDKLQDTKSKKVFENRLKFLLTRKREYMTDIHDKVPYFDESILNVSEIKNYIDLGTYTGDTIEQFCKLNDSYENIWGFEPDNNLGQIANDNLKDLERIKIVPCATSDFDGVMQVQSGLGVMQTIDNKYEGNGSTEKIFKVCKLDTYFADRDVKSCFVKMDIEGAELATLRGMREFIIHNAPTVAVCIYHKLEDMIEVSDLLDTYNLHRGRVKYYLRHYSDNQTETVLFAKMEDK